MTKTDPSHAAHGAVLAAATLEVHEDPHATDARPTQFELTPEQLTFLRTLHFFSNYELAHLRKTAPDVGSVFDDTALATIEAHPELGGPARAERIRAAAKQYQQLNAIAAVLGPLARLVGQNLMAAGATLASEAGEPLKVAQGLQRSKPELLAGLSATKKWTHAHYGRRPGAESTPTNTTG